MRVDPTQWETVEPAVRDPRWTTARCNDGTPFDFNVQLAPGPSKVWVIHLAGGAMCEDLGAQCSARDRVCEAAVAEPSACLFGPVWYPHVAARLPVLIQQSLMDVAFTGSHGIDVAQPAALAA